MCLLASADNSSHYLTPLIYSRHPNICHRLIRVSRHTVVGCRVGNGPATENDPLPVLGLVVVRAAKSQGLRLRGVEETFARIMDDVTEIKDRRNQR